MASERQKRGQHRGRIAQVAVVSAFVVRYIVSPIIVLELLSVDESVRREARR